MRRTTIEPSFAPSSSEAPLAKPGAAQGPGRGQVSARGDRELRSAIGRLLRERGAGKTICPSEAARAIDPLNWRKLMAAVRAEAFRMADAGEVVVLQRGQVVNGREARGALRIARADTSRTAYADAYRGVNFREQPELYRVGRGEQGVLIAEPYKSELLPLWRFKTEAVARASAGLLWKAFVAYRRSRDFVGMDMARKFLQMGFTRARRYANHASGRKFASPDNGRPRQLRAQLPLAPDVEKARAAAVFYEAWQKAERDRVYAAWRRRQRSAANGTK